MINKKMKEELDKLIQIAREQEGKLNANLVYIAMDDKTADYQEGINYLTSKDIEIIADDIEPDGSGTAVRDDVKPFDPKKIDISMQPMTLDSLLKRIEHGEVELNSAFQRKAGLWSIVQKSQLIESIFLRIPLPAFYFDASIEDNWVIIDGLQRTTTLKEFVVDKTLKLQGMEFFPDLDGIGYDKLPRLFQRRIDETQINVYLVNPATPENVKFNIFKRINTGGLALEAQEIRNALYQGNATIFLSEMAKKPEFIKATGGSIRSDRMLDREFVLRFVSFCYLDLTKYHGSIDEFLNEGMIYLNRINKPEQEKIAAEFNSVMTICYQMFGSYTFRKQGVDGRRRPINKVIYELWCMLIKQLDEEDCKLLVANKKRVNDEFIVLCESAVFLSSLKGSDRRSLQIRMNAAAEMVNNILKEG